MNKQNDLNCCDLCHNLKIGDFVTIGLGATTVIIGSVINKVYSNDCKHLIISAESLSVNGSTLYSPSDPEEAFPVTICCRDINMIIKSLTSLS